MTRTARRLTGAIALATATALLTACSAGGAPTDPAAFPEPGSTLEWIVPSAAGAGNDILARIVAPVLSEELGATVQVVNREGGNQVIGLTELAGADPDGTTFGYTNVPSILGRYLDPAQQATFDRESFEPIGSFTSNVVVVAVPAASPATTLADLFGTAQGAPGTVTAGTDSRAGDDHVNLATLERGLGIDLNVVHYDSGADKAAALLSGEIDMAVGGVSSFIGPFRSGDVRLLAVVADERTSFAPDMPTLTEAGYPGIDPMTSRFALSVPAGTPELIVTRLQDALEAASTDPEVVTALEGAGTAPAFLDSAATAALWAEREAAVAPIMAELLVQH